MGGQGLTDVSDGVAIAGVFFLSVVAPFEVTRPLVRLPWQSISNLEAALLVALGAWGVALVRSRAWHSVELPLASAWIALVGAMTIATIAAPAAHVNAWHMTGRLVAAGAVYALTVAGVTSPARLRIALSLVVASGVVVAVLALLEYFSVGPVLRFLRLFRPGVIAVGAQVRAGGPLQYPTIASMYLEVVFAFGLGLMLSALDAGQRGRALVWFGALALVGHAIALTFTRAGLIVMAASALLVCVVRARRDGLDRGVGMIGALAAVVVGLFALSRPPESLWLRLTSEGQDSWYRARVDAPAELAFASDEARHVDVSVTNTGRVAWDSRSESPIYFSYHWLDASGTRVVAYEGERTALADAVPPSATVAIRAVVRAPKRPGEYRVEWDLEQEDRLWFNTEQNAPEPAVSRARVTGEAIGGPLITTERPRRAVRPGRFVLWRAAIRMFAAHPLLGVGPDNFRLLYGPYAGLAAADPRIHSNNMYLEVLVSGGLLAAVVFIWFLRQAYALFALPGRTQVGPRSDPGPTQVRPGSDPGPTSMGIGIAAAGMAIALHATVDSFLSFAPTYILFALTLGFAAAVARGVETAADAHRA